MAAVWLPATSFTTSTMSVGAIMSKICVQILPDQSIFIHEDVGGNKDFGRLHYPMDFEIAAGTKIFLGKNAYHVVNSFTDNLHDLPGFGKPIPKMTLPAGTVITWNNGMTDTLRSNMTVEFITINIKLSSGTKLQQAKYPVQFELPADDNAVLYASDEVEKMETMMALMRDPVIRPNMKFFEYASKNY